LKPSTSDLPSPSFLFSKIFENRKEGEGRSPEEES